MKPITADNTEGRVLLALRAGPMTPGEVHGRVNTSVPSWLIKSGLVVQDSSYYRITEAGRAACPFRNPLAAHVARPAIQEPNMARENIVTRQQVLAAIVGAGPAGMTRKALIQQFECDEPVIDNHMSLLFKQTPPVVFKPEKGRMVGIQFNDQEAAFKPAAQQGFTEKQITDFVETLEPEPIPQAPAVAQPMADEMVLESPIETIEIVGISDRRAPVVLDQPDATVIGIFSDGQLEITDSFHSFKLTQPVVAKLRGFLGLFSEAL